MDRACEHPLDPITATDPPGEPSLSAQGEPPRETVVRSAAVGDLLGTGAPCIVVASARGRFYAFTPPESASRASP